MRRASLAGALANLIFTSASLAQPLAIEKPYPKFANDAQCEKGATYGLGTFAKQLNQVAIEEWENFGRQTVEADGKLSIFGGAEAETNELVAGGAKINKDAPWYNVYRYWLLLSGGAVGNDRFRPYSYKNHDFLDPNGATGGVVGNHNQSAQNLIGKINGAVDFNENDKIVISDALIRASIIDAPWSATFISAMHIIALQRVQGILPQALNFRLSSRHSNYIKEAYLTAKNEVEGVAGVNKYDRYRACDPAKTQPRVGDMLCYVRLGTAETFKKYSLSDSFNEAAQIYFYGDDEKLRNTHCDIISAINKDEVEVIGGNVLQSVTKKILRLDKRTHALAPSNYDDDASLVQNDKICKTQNCRLNSKPWFVLLQSRY